MLKRYRLPGFTIGVRYPTPEERRQVDSSRDCLVAELRSVDTRRSLVCVMGSPMVGSWDEDSAARCALSFAAEPGCWDDPADNAWSREHGEDLTDAAFCHKVLGKELRQ